jgi:hypothetical protein
MLKSPYAPCLPTRDKKLRVTDVIKMFNEMRDST